jgi:uncharacterized protein with gpF-like domain
MINLRSERAKKRYQQHFLRLVLQYEKSLSRQLGRILVRLVRQTAEVFGSNGLEAALSEASGFDEQIQKILVKSLTRVYTHFANERTGSIVGKNREFIRAAQQYATTVGAAKVQNISNTTRKKIQRVIEGALAEGLGVADIKRRIVEKTGGQIARNRARTIAQTEVHAAANAASHSAVESLNRPYRKEWISALQPERTRPAHLAAHGQVVEGNEQFIIDGEGLRFPGDPNGSPGNIINCRCVVGYLI